MNTNQFWNHFEETGDIMDYLFYRGVETCNQTFREKAANYQGQAGEQKSESYSDSNRYGFNGGTYR